MSPTILRRSLLAATLTLTIGAAGTVTAATAANPAAAAKPAAPATAAMPVSVALRVTVATTSDWTSVQLGVPWAVDYRVRSQSGGTTVSVARNGWVLKAPAGGGSVTLDAVVTLPSGDIPLLVKKGWIGTTTVTLKAGAATPVTVRNDVRADPAVVWGALPRTTAEAGKVVPKRADARRLVLAFYFPWFSSYGQPTLTDRPADPRPSNSTAGTLAHARQARAHGVDGFVVAWQSEALSGRVYDTAVAAAAQTGGVVAPYLEVNGLDSVQTGGPAALEADVAASLRDVQRRSANQAVLRSGSVPVVFTFGMPRLSPAAWKRITADLATAGTPVRLVGDAAGAYYAAEFGVHQFTASTPVSKLAHDWQATTIKQRAKDVLDGTSQLVTATVQPGWDDSLLRGDANPVIPRDAGARYDGTWDAALSADPDWVLVTSWNEWFEGTSIEPGVEQGDLALRQTAARASAWRGPVIGSAKNGGPVTKPARRR